MDVKFLVCLTVDKMTFWLRHYGPRPSIWDISPFSRRSLVKKWPLSDPLTAFRLTKVEKHHPANNRFCNERYSARQLINPCSFGHFPPYIDCFTCELTRVVLRKWYLLREKKLHLMPNERLNVVIHMHLLCNSKIWAHCRTELFTRCNGRRIDTIELLRYTAGRKILQHFIKSVVSLGCTSIWRHIGLADANSIAHGHADAASRCLQGKV